MQAYVGNSHTWAIRLAKQRCLFMIFNKTIASHCFGTVSYRSRLAQTDFQSTSIFHWHTEICILLVLNNISCQTKPPYEIG